MARAAIRYALFPMTRRRFIFDTPDRFAAGTVGEPGNRTFFLQARDGARITSVALEKVQVAVLAQRLTELLDEPINEAFRVGTLSMGWDTQDELVLVEARELLAVDEDEEAPEVEEEFDDEDEDGPDFLRVRLTTLAARAFVVQALRLISAGRPPCPLCGQPLDPQGHLCPRRNGTAPLLN